MNYYEHHIRDYDAATAHLSWDEDMAYSRMLRWYYRKEKPLPSDVAEVCRQIRAATDLQRDAVAVVLQEFFDLRADGWHQNTCDDVISAYRAGEPEREAKKKNEDTRLARHRAERSELFAVINAAGLHRPWNSPIAELRELAARLLANSAPATPAATKPATPATPPAPAATPVFPSVAPAATATATSANESATRTATATATPATATHTPVPRHQTPDTNKKEGDGGLLQIPAPAPPAFAGERNLASIPKRAVVLLAPDWELPESWGTDAEALGFKPAEILRESERFRQYWVSGKGADGRKSIRGWRQAWSNWLGNAERYRRTA